MAQSLRYPANRLALNSPSPACGRGREAGRELAQRQVGWRGVRLPIGIVKLKLAALAAVDKDLPGGNLHCKEPDRAT